ncbi:MAG: pYEATS domain-containing protein [Spirochaetota bacterium]
MRKHLIPCLLLLAFFSNFASESKWGRARAVRKDPSTYGLTGVLSDEKIEVTKVPLWPKKISSYKLPPYVDLRYNSQGESLFPPVARQKLNDSLAWSLGYYLKTYLENQKTESVIASAERMYSPSFLYNHLQQQNKGSYPLDNLRFLQKYGISSLQRMPYTLAYRRLPSQETYLLAKRYRIQDFRRVKTLAQFKQALFAGNPILAHIYADSWFIGGRYSIYKSHKKRVKFSNRYISPGHSIVIVGYDDVSQSFLFLNSWGQNWGRQGVNRFHYSLVEKIPKSREKKKRFIEAAYIAFDHLSAAVLDKVIKNNVEIQVKEKFIGYQRGKPLWLWKAFLSSKGKSLQKVDKVEWSFNLDMQHLSTGKLEAWNAFEVYGISQKKGSYKVQATVHFKDKSSQSQQENAVFFVPDKSSVQIRQKSDFYQRRKGKLYWEWKVFLEGSMEDMHAIKQVTYHFHPNFPEKQRVVTQSAKTGFSVRIRGPISYPVRADVEYIDGHTTQHSIALEPSESVFQRLTIRNTSLPIGLFGKKKYYNITLFLDGPLHSLRSVKKVEYRLHNSYRPNRVIIKKDKKFGFPLSLSGWGVFQVKARVFFSKKHFVDLKHTIHL